MTDQTPLTIEQMLEQAENAAPPDVVAVFKYTDEFDLAHYQITNEQRETIYLILQKLHAFVSEEVQVLYIATLHGAIFSFACDSLSTVDFADRLREFTNIRWFEYRNGHLEIALRFDCKPVEVLNVVPKFELESAFLVYTSEGQNLGRMSATAIRVLLSLNDAKPFLSIHAEAGEMSPSGDFNLASWDEWMQNCMRAYFEGRMITETPPSGLSFKTQTAVDVLSQQ